jgi:hypothetical protein
MPHEDRFLRDQKPPTAPMAGRPRLSSLTEKTAYSTSLGGNGEKLPDTPLINSVLLELILRCGIQLLYPL